MHTVDQVCDRTLRRREVDPPPAPIPNFVMTELGDACCASGTVLSPGELSLRSHHFRLPDSDRHRRNDVANSVSSTLEVWKDEHQDTVRAQ